ncbi:Protein LMBR1L [Varanus komodoensis]|nr:Protein LMBR1L [Varanus komodoensis]
MVFCRSNAQACNQLESSAFSELEFFCLRGGQLVALQMFWPTAPMILHSWLGLIGVVIEKEGTRVTHHCTGGLWNLVFLFSNLSLVFLMPFAYFFTESEGFAGSKKGIMARVYETFVVLLLLTLLILGMVWVASAIVDNDAASRESLYDLWEYYLPYLYSCISLFGVLLLLLCTPFGLSRMFTVTGTLLVKPRLLEDLDEQLNCTGFEEAAISRKISSGKTFCWLNFDMEVLRQQYLAIHMNRITLETRRKASAWQRNLGYPLAMLSLLSLTAISVLVVCFHVLELLLDDAAMPRGIQDAPLGKVSFSIFGSFGAALQVVLIFYLMVSSLVGFYSSPLFTKLLPERHDTAMTKIIGNCVSLLVLSSALPVLSRTLGITRFDLLGDFGRFNWLGNFYIVFLYNMLFAGLTTLCLVKKFTWAVQGRGAGEGNISWAEEGRREKGVTSEPQELEWSLCGGHKDVPPQAPSTCDTVPRAKQAQLERDVGAWIKFVKAALPTPCCWDILPLTSWLCLSSETRTVAEEGREPSMLCLIWTKDWTDGGGESDVMASLPVSQMPEATEGSNHDRDSTSLP